MLAGVPFLDFLPLACSGSPGPGDFGRVIGRKYAGRGISVLGSLAPEAGSFNQTRAFVGVEAT